MSFSQVTVDRRHLHLAAFMQTHGARLIDYRDDTFYFETEKCIDEWRSMHQKSESLEVDKRLLNLRDLVRRGVLR